MLVKKHSSLFEHKEGSDLYKNTKNDPRFELLRKRLEKEYDYVKNENILDKDFVNHFRYETKARILELDVAFLLYKSCEDSPITVSNGSQGKTGGPDFKIEYDNYRIFIECVCAHDAEEDNVDPECIFSNEWYMPYAHGWTQRGFDKRKVSRIASVISDKSDKIKTYRSRGIITDQDIVLLVVGDDFKKDPKMSTDALWELEEYITYRVIVEVDGGVEFINNDNGKFKKAGKEIKSDQNKLNQFNGFIYAGNFFCDKNYGGLIFNYTVYIRKLQFENLKEIIGGIFHTKCTEYNRNVYRADGHESCSEKAIYQAGHNKA